METLDDIEIHEPLLHDGDLSTAPTTDFNHVIHSANKFELFEKLLSFIETNEQPNDVLSGYFSKVLG